MAKVAFLNSIPQGNHSPKLFDVVGNEFALPTNDEFLERCKKVAESDAKVIRVVEQPDGELVYVPALRSKVEMDEVTESTFPSLWNTLVSKASASAVQHEKKEKTLVDQLNDLASAKPKRLKLSDIKWRYLLRCALIGKNILMVGDHGSGKTFAAYCLARVLPDHKFFTFNLGATQDPRGELIGNTHFDKENGTIFKQSEFVRAITTPGAIILLDELSRAHPDAWNILMTVLDDQKYLRISEDPETPRVNVAPGVSFILTANVGIKYTSTRAVDAALLDRCQLIEFDLMNKNDMYELLMELSPDGRKTDAMALAGIYETIKENVLDDEGKLQSILSTRQCIEAMDMLTNGGFKIQDVAEVCIYPFFDKDGGADSERTFVQQTVQRFIPKDEPKVESQNFTTNFDFEKLSKKKPF